MLDTTLRKQTPKNVNKTTPYKQLQVKTNQIEKNEKQKYPTGDTVPKLNRENRKNTTSRKFSPSTLISSTDKMAVSI